jgi:hypothetical protein
MLGKPAINRIGRVAASVMLALSCGLLFWWFLFAAGNDCNPPDDADLLLTQSEGPYGTEGNGWVALSNALSRVEGDWLHNEADLDSNGVETFLRSNAWLSAEIDGVLSSPTFIPPPVNAMPDNRLCQPFRKMVGVNRSVLLMRVKREIDKGDFDTAIEYYRRNLRLATLLQTHCRTFPEYLVGIDIVDEDVSFFEHMMDTIPIEKLKEIDAMLKDLPGLSPEAVAHALKREYSCLKERVKTKPMDIVFPNRPSFLKRGSRIAKVSSFVAEYAFQPNRSLRILAKSIRGAMQGDVLPLERETSEWWRTDLTNALVPNCVGRGMVAENYESHVGRVNAVAEHVESVRRKIAGRIAKKETNNESMRQN